MRTEKDFLGEKLIPDEALYGIHSLRAKENFPDYSPFHIEWFKAIGTVKLACYITYKKYKKTIILKFQNQNIPIQFIDEDIIDAMISAAEEIAEGKYYNEFIIPAISGGAGTSINMNINEIIANVSLSKLGHKYGSYNIIDPIEHANIFQSTNDVIPTSLKLTVLKLLNTLENAINNLRSEMEKLEKQYRNTLRIAYTQMQQAVPSSYGKLFSSYNDALSRDWWRVSKCFERIKVVNLGGSAIGTGMTVPRFFIMEVVPTLQKISNLPISRSENLCDTTNNLDSFVEVHAILKAHAVNLEKITNDIRLLASDINADKELKIPSRQVGSSIMPGKINPVIPEFTISIAHKIYANDSLITSLCAQGCLDLNAYLPIIGNAIIDSLKLLIAADTSVKNNLLEGLTINTNIAVENIYKSPSITTALIPYIGYHKASLLAKKIKEKNINIIEANIELKLIEQEKLKDILIPENLLKLGYSINDILKGNTLS